ncbi:MAG: signal peptide peptidase SppA [Bacteroidota bacterium]|jgi:protease-4
MRQFFKFMFASMFGFMLAGILLLVILIGILAGIASGESDSHEKPEKPSWLVMNLDEPISDRGDENPLRKLSSGTFSTEKSPGLYDICRTIQEAAEDKNIAGIFLLGGQINTGMATAKEIRNTLKQFKKSGKKIWVYADVYSQSGYYLASVADQIYLNPKGALEVKGISSNLFFLKNALAKLDIQPQIIRHGKFKSAVEPFTEDHMSEANRLQIRTMQHSMWEILRKEISESRKINPADFDRLCSNYTIRNAEDAKKNKLVDNLLYYDQVLEKLKAIASDDDKPACVSMNTYFHAVDENEKHEGSDRIAVIYAGGDIVDGKGDDNSVGGDTYAKLIREARKDKKVKAIVLRINSPGGSSLASEVMWREINLAKKEKPVVASMGDVAASGGYYIACDATEIVANPLTITGSIGVFGLMFNAGDFFKNKIGITFDTVKTHAFADIGSQTRNLTEAERAIMQESVEEVYSTFTGRVADGRKIPLAMVDSIGQGRVWLGSDAKNLKLIDRFGGLQEAIERAAKLAKLDSYRIREYPTEKNPVEKLLGSMDDDMTSKIMESKLGALAPAYRAYNRLLTQKGVLARLEFEFY